MSPKLDDHGNMIDAEVEPDLEGTPDPRSEPVPAEPQKGEKTDWKAKYDGLQGYARQQRAAAVDWQAKFNNLSGDHEAAVADRDARIQELEKQVAELTSKTNDLTQVKTRLEKQNEIGRKVRTEFPVLYDLFEEGLLRTDGLEGEELDTYLANLSEKLHGQVGSAVKQTLRGTTPPRPSGQRASQSADEIMEVLMGLSPESPEYKVKLTEYEQALRAEDQSRK